MGLYSLMIDNLFKKIESQKEEVPFFLFFFFKKIKTLLARNTITKKEKKDTLEGISISPGKNHEGRYTFQIFFERRISKPRVYRVHSPAALPWNSAPQNSDLSIDIYAVYTHGAYIHIYLLSIASLLLFSFALCATVVIRSMQIPLQNRGKRKRRRGRITRREKQFCVSRGYRRVIFSDLWNPVTGWRWREKSIEKSRRGIDERILERRILNSLKEGISFLFLFLFIRSNEALSNNNRSRDKILSKKDVFWTWNNWVFLFQRKARK